MKKNLGTLLKNLTQFLRNFTNFQGNFIQCLKEFHIIITTLLLGRSHFGAPFWDVFSISVALSLGVVLRLSNIIAGGSEARVVGRNTRRKLDNKKKNFKNHIFGSIITSKDFYQ